MHTELAAVLPRLTASAVHTEEWTIAIHMYRMRVNKRAHRHEIFFGCVCLCESVEVTHLLPLSLIRLTNFVSVRCRLCSLPSLSLVSSFVSVCEKRYKTFLNQLKSIRPRNGNRNNGNVAYFPVTILYVCVFFYSINKFKVVCAYVCMNVWRVMKPESTSQCIFAWMPYYSINNNNNNIIIHVTHLPRCTGREKERNRKHREKKIKYNLIRM